VVTVTRLDRLGAIHPRSFEHACSDHRQESRFSLGLGDTWADTTTAHGRLMLTVLAGLAEFGRDLIRARTGEGRERAKARGVKLGRNRN
jgi:DNA invertase Pin-like site-specific DNA recombinase